MKTIYLSLCSILAGIFIFAAGMVLGVYVGMNGSALTDTPDLVWYHYLPNYGFLLGIVIPLFIAVLMYIAAAIITAIAKSEK